MARKAIIKRLEAQAEALAAAEKRGDAKAARVLYLVRAYGRSGAEETLVACAAAFDEWQAAQDQVAGVLAPGTPDRAQAEAMAAKMVAIANAPVDDFVRALSAQGYGPAHQAIMLEQMGRHALKLAGDAREKARAGG